MTTSDETTNRRRLAELVKLRRQELDLSVRQAAENAGVARNTWISAEDGSRRTADNNYGGIERALRWQTGSIADTLSGGRPTPIPDATQTAPVRTDPADEALIRVMRSDLSDQQKAAIVRKLISEAEASRKRLLDLADSYVRGTTKPPSA